MTGQELIDEIRELVDEPAPTSVNEEGYFTDVRILSMLNKSNIRIYKKTGCVYRKTNFVNSGATNTNVVTSVAASPKHFMPSDFLKIHPIMDVWWNASDGAYPIDGADKLGLSRDTREWWGLQRSGNPEVYVLNQQDMDEFDDAGSTGHDAGIMMDIYPWPSAAGTLLNVYYIPIPPTITATTGDPVYDEDFQWALIYNVGAMLKEKREKWAAADRYNARYEAVMKGMITYYNQKDEATRRQIPITRGRGGITPGANIIIHP